MLAGYGDDRCECVCVCARSSWPLWPLFDANIEKTGVGELPSSGRGKLVTPHGRSTLGVGQVRSTCILAMRDGWG